MGGPLIRPDGSPLVAPRPRASMPATPAPAYHAADAFSQELAGWWPGLGAPDHEWSQDRDRTVARTRDLVRNDGWASGAVTKRLDAVVGAQLRLSAKPDWRALGLDADWAAEWAAAVEAEFRGHFDHPMRYGDTARALNFGGLCALAYRHRMIDGDALATLPWRPNRGSLYATTVQVVDPDRLSTPDGMVDGERLRRGIELDRDGAAIAYRFRRSHPADWDASFASQRWDRVARQTAWGRPQVVHYWDKGRTGRAGQTRGTGLFAPIVERLKMLTRYDRVELQAAVLNAILAAYLESPFDPELIGDALDDQRLTGYQELRGAFHEKKGITLGGVRIPALFPGERLAFHSAARPATQFDAFEGAMLRNVASALGMTYEQLSQDWSGVNYSSARAALIEVWRGFGADRAGFAQGFPTPIYVAFLEEAIDRGRVSLPPGAPGFYEAVAAYSRCEWIGPGRGWVDPEKEARAAVLRMSAGLSTLQRECAEQGLDYQEVLEQRQREIAMMREMDIPLPDWTNVAAMTSAGPVQGTAP